MQAEINVGKDCSAGAFLPPSNRRCLCFLWFLVMDTINHSVWTELRDFAMRFPFHWLVVFLVLSSMVVQLVLVILGGLRYRHSNSFLRFVVWVGYAIADPVAILALGKMMHDPRRVAYGIWAPLLLLHLGGPDAITAYSLSDNELWSRRTFTMLYQISVAAYVTRLSVSQGYLVAAALLLLLVGATKYVERNAALRFSSYSETLNSTQPIYAIMQREKDIAPFQITSEECLYLVRGDKQIYEKLQRRPSEEEPIASWAVHFSARNKIVTTQNVLEREGSKVTDDYILCLSYALFKMYKRRFVSLFFHEAVLKKTRNFFLNGRLEPTQVFRIMETELKFMYDDFFSKCSGTAFSRYGALVRLLNICLLGIACFLLICFGFKDKPFKQAQGTVTWVLISVALAVEVYQVCRVLVSDWMMVRLICSEIKHSRQRGKWFHRYSFKFIKIVACVLHMSRKWMGGKYWKNVIHQYCVLNACLSTKRGIWKLAPSRLFNRQEEEECFIVTWYFKAIKAMHTKAKPVEDNLKEFILKKIKDRCSPDEEIETCRENVYNLDWCFSKLAVERPDLLRSSKLEMEERILTWHIATAICEKEQEDGVQDSNKLDNICFSRKLSMYCAYLLTSHPNILPLHAEIATMSCMKIHVEMVKNIATTKWTDYRENNTTLGKGTELARQLLGIEFQKRWEILADYWAGLLIYISLYSKATFHAECLTTGGEFLSQLWVLMAHMGCGEQSDSAVTKKMEDK